MLDRPPSRLTRLRKRLTEEALRARRHRARRRRGQVSRRIDVDEYGLAEALIESGRLTPDEALRPELVERELSVLIDDFISRWRNGVTRQ